jgi:hypothetical protein
VDTTFELVEQKRPDASEVSELSRLHADVTSDLMATDMQ